MTTPDPTLAQLREENAQLRAALRQIEHEAQQHGETNRVSGTSRLPLGYQTILRVARAALSTPLLNPQPKET